MDPKYKRPVIIWLYLVCFLVFLMVIVGGITRLTGSGLSMVEWRPLMGAIPPLNQEGWLEVFKKYQQFPQFKIQNHSMTLDEFKFIFLWEYGHRLLGRLIGVVFLLPLLYFQFKKAFNRSISIRLWFGFFLGGLQGLMGWYMVKSGLVDIPAVSHYRLAAHLLLAFLIFAYLFWIALDIQSNFNKNPIKQYSLSWAWTALVTFQIIYGAFVAGKHAGHGYNTFPKMGENWIPSEISSLSPLWLNFFENNSTLQFVHRSFGWLLLFLALFVIAPMLRSPYKKIRQSTAGLTLLVVAQFSLGVLTLIHVVPIQLASFHQAGGLLVFASSLFWNHQLKNPH